MTIDLPDLDAMTAFGRAVSAALRPGDVIALSGALGAGKTTLARAILNGAGYAGEVPSPTFTIMELYEPPAVDFTIIHADFYRLADAGELEELGLSSLRENAALIAEWPERVGGFGREPGCLGIELLLKNGGRTAIVTRGTDWEGRKL